MITFPQIYYKIQSIAVTIAATVWTTVWTTVGATLAVAPMATAQTLQAQTLQIEAPKEIAQQISEYAKEIEAHPQNATLKATTTTIQLIKNGKIVKEIKIDPAIPKNIALQNAVHEIFGHPTEKTTHFSGPLKTILIGTGFVAAGVLLYYSNTPKPVERK